ncbi:MAG: HesB/IscA family protein [Phycisphaerae bacterium]
MGVSLSEAAAREVKAVIEQQNKDAESPKPFYLRVGVKGGGCSGLSYTLDLEDTKAETDESFDCFGVEVICDTRCLLYLEGTTVDFKDELMGRGFVFNNPNPTSTCGCGSSFTM